MKIKKKEVEPLLYTLQFQKEGVEYGLLTEEMPMSLRRFLQKIRKELITQYEEIRKDIVEIASDFRKKAISELPSEISEKEYLDPKSEHHKLFQEKYKSFSQEQDKEFITLMDEEFELTSPLASMEMILAIKTDKNYDFDLLEKIAQ